MKKLLQAISVLISTTLLVTSLASTVVFAEVRSDFEKRSLPTYLFDMEDMSTTECVFFEDEPDVAYIDPVDYLSRVYTTSFSQEKSGDGIYTVTKSTGETMKADVNVDILSFDSFENFVFDNVDQEGTASDAEYDLEHPAVINGEKRALCLICRLTVSIWSKWTGGCMFLFRRLRIFSIQAILSAIYTSAPA